MKIVVIGCTHAGTFAIKNAREMYPDAEIVVYERNNVISFLSCGIALNVGGVVKDINSLFYSSPEELRSINVTTKMEHDVINVDFDKKELVAKNLKTGEEFTDNFDKAIITTGSWPICPPIKGADADNVLLCKNYNHNKIIVERAKEVEKITVVGAGYIGVELVEAFRMLGKEVTLIDATDRILSKYLDKEYTDIAEKAFTDDGVVLGLGELVSEFKKDENGKAIKVVTNKNEYDTDLVILCVGFRPNTDLFRGKLEMTQNGSIKVDKYLRTSNKDVMAAGDCCSVRYNPTGEDQYIPLATNAVRMGSLAGINLTEDRIPYLGTQGTSGIKIYEDNYASTGMTECVAKEKGYNVDTIILEDNHRPEFMPDYEKVMIKLVFDKDTKRVLGGQIVSKIDLTQNMNTLSVCIQNNMTLAEVTFVDSFFQPHYNKPLNFLNAVALAGLKK